MVIPIEFKSIRVGSLFHIMVQMKNLILEGTFLHHVHPIGKFWNLYGQCLPITIDVETNGKLLNDEFYIGLRQKRATGKEYYDLLEEFMRAVKQNYGEKVLVQFEDFANHNAFELLARYRTTHLVFNGDIQGTASVVLSGVVVALKLLGGSLADQKVLFLGVGEAGTGIAELIALEMSKKSKIDVLEARKKIWLVDSKGLIVSLEPCNNYGQTPPCTVTLICAKVKWVVIGMVDPKLIVASEGVERLNESGIIFIECL